MTAAAVFDALGTLFDLGRAGDSAELARTLHHATSLTLVDEFAPLAHLARSVDEKLPERLSDVDPYEDADEALRTLGAAGVDAYVLTNGTAADTRELLREGDLLARVADVFSVEDVRRYKPDAAPYAHAARAIGRPPSELAFVSAHEWDVLGAAKAGYQVVWVDRRGGEWSLPTAPPELRASDLVEAARLILATR
jgi:2-haloalkanoic acid dehalogenase type II